MMRMRTLVLPLLASAMLGCYSEGDTPKPGAVTATGVTAEARAANEAFKTKLAKNCAGCHDTGANKPFFQNISSFENLFVYNPAYITPGKPDESELVRLLQNKGTLTYKQMPPGGDAFATLAEKGQTDIDMAGVRAFVAALQPRQIRAPRVDPNALTVQTMDAHRIQQALFSQLGVSPETDNLGELLIRDPDGADPARTVEQYSKSNLTYPIQEGRFTGLGGGNYLQSAKGTRELTPSRFLHLNQVAQNWCRLSVRKTGTPLLKYASLTDKSADKSADIKKNIGYLMTRMLGIFPSDAQVDALYTGVFLTYEKTNAETAWTATCAALVRHPLWASF
jgi:hypothetical protein